MIFFTSDLHLCSEETRKLMCRPFTSMHNMDCALINNINKMCTPDDTLYVLGDLFTHTPNDRVSWKGAEQHIRNIKCKMILIRGNKEDRMVQKEFGGDQKAFYEYCSSLGISSVIETGLILKLHGVNVYLTHKPEDCRNDMINVHGHIHIASRVDKFGINVATDLTGYYPVSSEYLFRMCESAAYSDGDSMRKFIGIKSTKFFQQCVDAWKPFYSGEA